jgi:tRNA-dihydrouridine synthase B
VLDYTRASAVMIGRAAHGSPWIFREVNSFLETGKKSASLLRTEIRDIILEHITALYAFHGEAAGVRIARKHLGWYCQQHTDTQGFRPQLMAAESSSVQFAVAAACFGAWSDNENKIPGQEGVNAGYDSEGRQDSPHAQAEHHRHA